MQIKSHIGEKRVRWNCKQDQTGRLVTDMKIKYKLKHLLELSRGPQGNMQMRVLFESDGDDTSCSADEGFWSVRT